MRGRNVQDQVLTARAIGTCGVAPADPIAFQPVQGQIAFLATIADFGIAANSGYGSATGVHVGAASAKASRLARAWIRAMVAARNLKTAPRVWETALFDVLHRGAIHAQRNLAFGLAGNCAGVAADTLAVVDDEAVIQAMLLCSSRQVKMTHNGAGMQGVPRLP